MTQILVLLLLSSGESLYLLSLKLCHQLSFIFVISITWTQPSSGQFSIYTLVTSYLFIFVMFDYRVIIIIIMIICEDDMSGSGITWKQPSNGQSLSLSLSSVIFLSLSVIFDYWVIIIIIMIIFDDDMSGSRITSTQPSSGRSLSLSLKTYYLW